ncbi:MAG: RsfS/YbeB/iojap family protein, partial [Akkermansia sp.]|nr:RsfS/YbeB/iojap family protein [Akkermansia sp.]
SVLDYIDVMVHIMAAEVRDFYGLEKFWKEENRIDWQPSAE